MPLLKIEVSLDSAASIQGGAGELARMLTAVPRVLEDSAWSAMNLRDSNGNTVGHCWIEEDD